jgi:hypothetical protein
MADRRTLVEGLKQSLPPLAPHEANFVFGEKAASTEKSKAAPPVSNPTGGPVARVPISTKMRGDYAWALKRASLERQLAAIEPNTLQDILEEAVEPWLKTNGYLT